MLTRILLPFIILALGAAAAYQLSQKPDSPEPRHVPPQKLKSEISELHRSDFPVLLESQGVVRAHHETTVTSTIAGTVTAIHPGFEDGAFFKKDEILLELDPADFQASLAAAQSRLARSEAAIAQEEARAKQARLNWEDLGYDEDPSDLVLRIPQLKEARANVSATTAEVDQAQRNLSRTNVRAPFDGRVRARLIGLGQAIGPSTALGEVFATDFAEIRLPLSPEQLAFINLPSHPDDPPVAVTLSDPLSSAPGESPSTWQAKIIRTEGALDEASRELFAIARIDDVFGISTRQSPLRIGQPVRALIEGKTLKDVFVIPRQALRGVNTIYLVTSDEPVIKRTKVEPIWSTADVIIVRDELVEGQWLSTTRLPYAPDGAPVEVIEPSTAASQESERSNS